MNDIKCLEKYMASWTQINATFDFQVPCAVSDNKCQNNGTCYVNGGYVLCTCPPGYEGYLCEVLIDNCATVPCLHGGKCTNQVNNFTCECTQFYEGSDCSIRKLIF